MAIVALPRSWGRRRPPPGTKLDPSHPLAAGLVFALALNEGGGGRALDAARGASATLAGGATWGGSTGPGAGTEVRLDGSTGRIEASAPPGAAGLPLTLVAWVRPSSALTGARILTLNPIGSLAHVEGLHIDGAGHLNVQSYNGTINRSPTAAATVAGGLWYHVAGVITGPNSTLYVNGVQAASDSTAFSSGTALTGIQIGRNDWTPAEYFAGSVAWASVYSRALTAAEVAALYRDPFAMFARPSTRRYFDVAGGGSTTPVSGSDAGSAAEGTPALAVALTRSDSGAGADSGSAADPSNLLTGLAAYWELDEASGAALDALGATDLADNGSVGTAAGKVSTSRSFDGSTQSFSHAATAALAAGDTDWTLAAWCYLADKTNVSTVASRRDGSGAIQHALRYTPMGDRFLFFVSSDGDAGGLVQVVADTFGSPSANTWHHVVAWHDSVANQVGIAVDAGTTELASAPSGVLETTATFRLGATSVGEYWTGRLDEVGFWHRVLTGAERAALYNTGAGLAFDSFGGGSTAPVSGSDSGSAAEGTPAVLAALATAADAGAGSESAPTLLAGPAGSDAAAGSELASVVASASGADAGTGTDAGSVFAGLSLSGSDSGAAAEATVALAAALATAESGAGLDGPSLAASPTGADAGAGSDAGSVFSGLALSSSDSAAGAEGTPTILASASPADAAAGAEAASVAATLAAGESGVGSESWSLLLAIASADSGAGVESGAEEDVTGAVTIQLASADAGAGLEATAALAAALEDVELPEGADSAWVLVGTVAAPYRDRQLLRLLADALRDTAEFDEVLTSGLPEDHGRTASDLRLACLELDHWADSDHWADFASTEQVRTVAYTLHLLVRAEDPDLRDDELDRLASVASNTLNGIALGDVSIPNKTRLLRGKYLPAAGPERRMAVAGQFVYTIPDFDRHTAAEDA